MSSQKLWFEERQTF